MNKKAITILGAIFLLIVGTVGFLIFQNSNKDTNTGTDQNQNTNTNTDTSNNNTNTGTDNPPISEPPIVENDPVFTPPIEEQAEASVKLTNVTGGIISPVLFFSGDGVSYFNTQGQLFQAELDFSLSGVSLDNTKELTVPLKSGVRKVLWPIDGNNFIIEYLLTDRPAWSVYVANQGEYVDLPKEVMSVGWSPLGDKILYVWLDGNGVSTLNVANPDNSGWQTITDFWENDNVISIAPDGKNIIFYETKNESDTNKINIVTADGKVFKSVVKDGYNTGAVWSPDSRKFLFLKKEPASGKYILWMANLFSGELKNLGLATSLDKVTWGADSQYIYAAVPSLGGGDTLHKISLASGEEEKIGLGLIADATDLFLTSTQDYVLYKNGNDGQLYAIKLP